MEFSLGVSSARLVTRRDELARQLGLLAEFTPGSLQSTPTKCGKPTCHCAREGDLGHPRLTWVRYEQGRTRTTAVPARLADEVREGVEAGRRWVDQVQEITVINAELARRRLLRPGVSWKASVSSGEKGGSRSQRSG